MWRSAVVKAVVGYLVFVAPLLLVAFVTYDNVSRTRVNQFEIYVSLVILLVALQLALLFQPWRRAFWDLVKARKWQLGVWRDRPFASSRTSEAALKERASSLDTGQLLACHKWPDHTEPAARVMRQELQSRGLTAEAIDGWLPPAANITVPPRAPSPRRERWQSLEAGVFVLARILGFVGLPFAIVALLIAPFGGVLGLVPLIPIWGPLLLIVIPVGTLIRLQSPTRILLLRPFDQPSMTRTLKRIVLRHVGRFGHVYTLSDIHYRPNPFTRLGDVIGTGVRYAIAVLLRPSIRIATVKNARTYLALAGRLGDRIKPAFRHFVSGGQAYNIKSTNEWWQWCIDLLMHSSNAVVMDISRVSTGSAWEIEHIDVRAMLAKMIFIAQEAHEKHGSEALQRLLGDAQLPRVFLYTEAGEFREPGAFRQALAAKLHGRPPEPPMPVAMPPAAAIAQPVEPAPQPVVRVEPTPQLATLDQSPPQAPEHVEAKPQAAASASETKGLPLMAAAVIVVVIVVGIALGWPLLREDAAPPPPVPESPVVVQAAPRCADAELDWKLIETSTVPGLFETHLSRFPDCTFASLARQKIDFLKDCDAYRSEAQRLFTASTQEETAGLIAGDLLSPRPVNYRPRDPVVCDHMERAVRHSDELKRLVERKQAACTHIYLVWTHEATLARNHIGQFCRGPAPATTPAPPKGKSKETRPRQNTR